MSDPDNLLSPSSDNPRRFGDYLIKGLLGEGGMARVYDAEELLSRRPVALKVLRSEFARSEQGRRQFLTEMGILANIDDPHIVRCLSCVEIEQQPVMVLEHLDGWTLREMLEQRVALPWSEAASITLQIARALEAAHTRQPPVVHRDLKPENVMCLRDGRVKVMDFGIAKILQSLAGATTHPIGTLQYMSPEHVDARPVDPRSDLFALGVVLWEMLAGRPPFQSESPRVLLDQICAQPTPPLPDHVRVGLPVQIEQLLVRLLAKNPDERPRSATEVIIALEPLVGGPGLGQTRPQATPPPSPRPPPPRGQQQSQGQLDTIDIVESARKSPLQREVERQLDEVAEAVSRFGRATSTALVRVFVGLMIYPAAALIALGIPLMILGIELPLLSEQEGVVMFESDAETWVVPLVIPALLVSVVVFIRSCWVHHREAPSSTPVKLGLGIGALLFAGWAAVTWVEFGTDSRLDAVVHYAALAGISLWLVLGLSWGTGRIASALMRRLEHARR